MSSALSFLCVIDAISARACILPCASVACAISVISLCYLCNLALGLVFALCYLCAISVLSLCYLCDLVLATGFALCYLCAIFVLSILSHAISVLSP